MLGGGPTFKDSVAAVVEPNAPYGVNRLMAAATSLTSRQPRVPLPGDPVAGPAGTGGPAARTVGVATGCDGSAASQTVSNASGGVKLFWKTKVFDTGGLITEACADSLVAPRAGIYAVSAAIEWPAAGVISDHVVRLLSAAGTPLNADIVVSVLEGSPAVLRADLRLLSLAPGDYIVEAAGAVDGARVRQLTGIRVTR